MLEERQRERERERERERGGAKEEKSIGGKRFVWFGFFV